MRMKRREFIALSAAGLSASCSNQSGPPRGAGSAAPGAPPAEGPATARATQQVLLRAVGLCAFIAEASKLHVAMLNPEGIKIDDMHTLGRHDARLVVATAALADSTLGDQVPDDQLKKWGLRTKTKDFRMFDLMGNGTTSLALTNVSNPDLDVAVYGAVPMRQLYNGSISQWMSRALVSVHLELTRGLITDDAARPYENSSHKQLWKITTRTYAESTERPVRLTDTVKIELDAASPATFDIKKKGVNAVSVATKGSLVEAYLIPIAQIGMYEKTNFRVLHHVLAGYSLFDRQPTKDAQPIPKGDPDFSPMEEAASPEKSRVEEPVFCPPMLYAVLR